MGRPLASAGAPFAYFPLRSRRPVAGSMLARDGGSRRVPRPRIESLDIVRGAVMVLMAIDHVRVYSGVPAGGPTRRHLLHALDHALLRAGVRVSCRHQRVPARARTPSTDRRDTAALARYLVTRGLMLVLLELTVIRASWTFNFDYSQFILAGVIWMLGWCMVLLAGLVWLPDAGRSAPSGWS